MDLNDYQKQAQRTANYPFRMSPTDKGLHYVTLGLASEVGEVASLVKKLQRDGMNRAEFREKLMYELGDCLWYISQIAAEESLTLDQIGDYNIQKLASRQQRGVIGGSGDSR
jgi:NTP pyrophosphatase (non-canonical NTP hydrolase)